jgi:hypothetical protein
MEDVYRNAKKKGKGIKITSSAQNPEKCTPTAILQQQKIALHVIRTTNHEKKTHGIEQNPVLDAHHLLFRCYENLVTKYSPHHNP